MNSFDTIAAIATAPGEAAISIVRISGPRAFEIADKIFAGPGAPLSKRPGGTFVHGKVKDKNGGHADDVIALIMCAPNSYTGEHTIELQGHGGYVAVKNVFQAALDAGARSAEPGEFTKRAFLNGRMDLTQAEAVLDLIKSRSDRAAHSAMTQLEGALSGKIKAIYDAIMACAADLEASLDFSEDDIVPIDLAEVVKRLDAPLKECEKLLGTWEEGHLLRDGALIVLAGATNAGKSTLFNKLLGKERAIVSHHSGTTRDTIEELMILDGFPIRLVDTAGFSNSNCEIELEGIKRAKYYVKCSDICLYICESSHYIDENERIFIDSIDKNKLIFIESKVDCKNTNRNDSITDNMVIECSAKKEIGIEIIKESIKNRLLSSKFHQESDGISISSRHKHLVSNCLAEISKSIELLSIGDSKVVLAAAHLRNASECLGTITGKVYSTELLDAIFSRFCVGK